MANLSEEGWYIIKAISLPRDWYWLPEDFESTEYYYQYWVATDSVQIELSWDINSKHSIRIHKVDRIADDGMPLFDIDADRFHSSHNTRKKCINTAIEVMKEINNGDYPKE